MAGGPSKKRRLGVGEQIAWIGQLWGSNWKVQRAGSGFIAVGSVRPDGLSCEYRVQVSYAGKEPKVRVLDPPLRDRGDGQVIPHTYEGDLLCLYRPKYEEWNPSLLIAETIIPWISEWLYFYEVWLVAGIWLGGGEHPNAK